MPYRCRKSKKQGCGRTFSTKTGTLLEASNLGYRAWLVALFLVASIPKSASSMKLHRELSVTERNAWHVAHRLREALGADDDDLSVGPVEVDSTHFGRRRREMSNSKCKRREGCGPVGKTTGAGMRDRETNRVSAQVVDDTTGETLQGLVQLRVVPGATIYTDEATACTRLPNHYAVKHSIAEYVRGRVHTNGVESFYSTLKRAHQGAFHRLSERHLHRHLDEFVARHDVCDLRTLNQMASVVSAMGQSRLRYRDLVG